MESVKMSKIVCGSKDPLETEGRVQRMHFGDWSRTAPVPVLTLSPQPDS